MTTTVFTKCTRGSFRAIKGWHIILYLRGRFGLLQQEQAKPGRYCFEVKFLPALSSRQELSNFCGYLLFCCFAFGTKEVDTAALLKVQTSFPFFPPERAEKQCHLCSLHKAVVIVEQLPMCRVCASLPECSSDGITACCECPHS